MTDEELDPVCWAIMALVESGIDEDAHFWDSSWHEFDDVLLQRVIDEPELLDRVMVRLKPAMLERLQEVVRDRTKERSR
jgi:hypothetical protein